MPKCVVYHNDIPGAGKGKSIVFEGIDLKVSSTESGILTIEDWNTENQEGSAVFSNGTWQYACLIKDKSET